MERVSLVLLAALLLTPDQPAVRFIQPRAAFILSPPSGTEISVQVRITPSAPNRGYTLAWCTGSSSKTLGGADDSAIHPIRPLLIRVYPGTCELRAVVWGEGGRQLAMAELTLRVCGDQEECGS